MSGNESTLYACQTVISDAHANAAQIAGWLIELTALLNNTAADPPHAPIPSLAVLMLSASCRHSSAL